VPELELPAGTIEYSDTGGDGPVLVFLHGVMMDGTLWRNVIPALSQEFRCVLPNLPLGGHRRPMRADADLSLSGMARLVADFIDRLGLRDVTLVTNDWGGPQVLVAEDLTKNISRLILTSCEAFDNYPPGVPGRTLHATARMPGGLFVAAKGLRVPFLRRTPTTFGWMCKRAVPAEVINAWTKPARSSAAIRRDLRKYVLSVPPKAELLGIAEKMRGYQGETLVVWASEDRVMPLEHGRRLAEMIPHARLRVVADSYTLIPEDQPAELASHIRQFLHETATA
jgi:pimeloyl-ACP methyl ester carboxylesterase